MDLLNNDIVENTAKEIYNQDIFNNSDSNVVSIDKRFITFMTVVQLFYKKKLSDINIDIFEGADLMLITWRRGGEYHKFLFIHNKDSYNEEESKLINYYKKNNIKLVSVSFTPTELLSFLFQWLVEKYQLFISQQESYIKDTFYDFLVRTNLNDSALYIKDWYIKQNNEIVQISVNKNNRVNLAISTRKIENWLIKKIFWLTLRPNYTNLRFDDIKDSMLTLYKVEEYIYDFLSWGWIDTIKKEQPEIYMDIIQDENKKLNYWKKILNDFFILLDLLGIRTGNEQKVLLEQAQISNGEEKEEIFNKIDFFWSTLKWKDDISKFFTALESGSSLILVTWPTWSGKTTYLMTWLQDLLKKKVRNVVTLEDPIEFFLENDNWLIYQREINKDVKDYISWIKDSLRQKPDIIVLWEVRESTTENIARHLIEAAKTWHLVLWTMHATNLYDIRSWRNISELYDKFKKIWIIRLNILKCLCTLCLW